MKKILLASMVCTLLSCSNNTNDDVFRYTYYEDAELSIETTDDSYMQTGRVTAGENIVFEYEYTAEEEENIADDEYTEFIRFEISPNLSEFSYQDAELTDIKTVLTKICYCFFEYDVNKDVPPTGNIAGERISATQWRISVDVTFYGDERKTFENVFTLRDL